MQPPEPRPGDPLDLTVRVVGVAVSVWGAVLFAVAAAFLTPLRVGAVLLPVSVALAVVANAGLIWFAYEVTGTKFFGLLPGLVWVTMTFVGADRTTEGDLILYQKNWVATAYLLAGAATVGVVAYRMIVPRRPPGAFAEVRR